MIRPMNAELSMLTTQIGNDMVEGVLKLQEERMSLERKISVGPLMSVDVCLDVERMSRGERALAVALDNLNAAFGTGAEMPIDDWNVRSLAELAEIGGRKDIADCLRDALTLIADEQNGH